MEPVNKLAFVKGQKFVMNSKIWVVTEVQNADNADMRRVVADDGTDEVLTLTTLLKDVNTGHIEFVEKKNG